MRITARKSLLLGLVALAACRPPEARTADTDSPGLEQVPETSQATVMARLDSGNVAFADGDLEEALRHYRAAAEAGPGIPATWFGVYMAHHALGNQEAADSALTRAREQVPGSSLLRTGSAETAHR